MQAIRRTGYVADPIARRLAARHNRILGVFTYESVFPAGLGDFYHPFLVGIEECAERIGCDLLLFTSAPVVDGRRRIFHQDNRLRLADGCILLGQWLDPAELARLLAEGQPLVSVGRRDDAGGPVPYVGADYPAATAAQVRRAPRWGRTRRPARRGRCRSRRPSPAGRSRAGCRACRRTPRRTVRTCSRS
jgi:LacI family transcriptional regulator